MRDSFHLPGLTENNETWFYTPSGTVPMYQIWTKPRWCNMVSLTAIGGGGGGAGGTNTSATGSGCGGGGSGGVTKLIIPAMFLPDRLFVSVGTGGPGGAAQTTGTAGGLTTVLVQATNSANDRIISANGGSAGLGSSGGGAAGAAVGATNAIWMTLGMFHASPGIAGGSGSTGVGGSVVALAGNNITCGGASGGGNNAGVPSVGGDITGAFIFPTISGGAAEAAGRNGLTFFKPFCSCGGSGGGASTAGAAVKGGNGGYGSGGGGGGAATGGNNIGGNGGHGIVIIVAW
jgi:hypothetical protein